MVGDCAVVGHGGRIVKAIGLEQDLVLVELGIVGRAVRVGLVEATAIGLLRVGTLMLMGMDACRWLVARGSVWTALVLAFACAFFLAELGHHGTLQEIVSDFSHVLLRVLSSRVIKFVRICHHVGLWRTIFIHPQRAVGALRSATRDLLRSCWCLDLALFLFGWRRRIYLWLFIHILVPHFASSPDLPIDLNLILVHSLDISETFWHEFLSIAGVEILVRHTTSHHLVSLFLGNGCVPVVDRGVEFALFLAVFEGLFVLALVGCQLVTGGPFLARRLSLSEAVASLFRLSGWAELHIELLPSLVVSWAVIIDRRFWVMRRPVIG